MTRRLQALNPSTYAVAADNTSKSITIVAGDMDKTRFIVHNASESTAFIVSGVTAPTAVFPTSPTTPVNGITVAAGSTQSFQRNVTHGFISVILKSGSGDVFFTLGNGE